MADSGTRAVHAYLREAGGKELDFAILDGNLVDRQTGSTWNAAKGFAVDGPLQGTLLKQLPYITAYHTRSSTARKGSSGSEEALDALAQLPYGDPVVDDKGARQEYQNRAGPLDIRYEATEIARHHPFEKGCP